MSDLHTIDGYTFDETWDDARNWSWIDTPGWNEDNHEIDDYDAFNNILQLMNDNSETYIKAIILPNYLSFI